MIYCYENNNFLSQKKIIPFDYSQTGFFVHEQHSANFTGILQVMAVSRFFALRLQTA